MCMIQLSKIKDKSMNRVFKCFFDGLFQSFIIQFGECLFIGRQLLLPKIGLLQIYNNDSKKYSRHVYHQHMLEASTYSFFLTTMSTC